jgi:hypothetical protein
VVRLKSNSNKSGATTAAVVNRANKAREDNKPIIKKASVSMANITTNTIKNVHQSSKTTEERPQKFHEAATSTATTFGMLVAAAAVNKVKKTIDNRMNKKEVDEDNDKDNETTKRVPADEDPDGKYLNQFLGIKN